MFWPNFLFGCPNILILESRVGFADTPKTAANSMILNGSPNPSAPHLEFRA